MKYSRRLLGLGSSALLFTAVVSGCGGSSTSSDAAPIAFDQLPNSFADALCGNIGGCCQAASVAFDLTACKQKLSASLSQSLVADNKPTVKYDAVAAGNCVAAYASQIKTCKLDNGVVGAACKTVFTGTSPPGGACLSSAECMNPASGRAYCELSSSPDATATPQGVCRVDDSPTATPGAHGKQGQSCAGTCSGDSCSSAAAPSAGGSAGGPASQPAPTATCYNSDGLYCDAAGTCAPLAALGQPCADSGCQIGSFCQSGLCVASQPDGTACNDNAECVSGACLYDSGSTSSTCGNRVANAKMCAGDFE